MTQFLNELEELEKLKNKYDTQKANLIQNATLYGYTYNEDEDKFYKEENIVHVCNIYIRAETSYEESGLYKAYSALLEIPETLFLKIKTLMTNDKSDWCQIFDIINDYYEYPTKNILDGLYNCLDITNIQYIEESMIDIVDKECISNSREGIMNVYGEINLNYLETENSIMNGYITFFDMNEFVFDKNKFESYFTNDKYLRDNAPFIYHKD
jgi:hypothetical protein